MSNEKSRLVARTEASHTLIHSRKRPVRRIERDYCSLIVSFALVAVHEQKGGMTRRSANWSKGKSKDFFAYGISRETGARESLAALSEASKEQHPSPNSHRHGRPTRYVRSCSGCNSLDSTTASIGSGFHPHLPGFTHRFLATTLGATMWFFIFYRARYVYSTSQLSRVAVQNLLQEGWR